MSLPGAASDVLNAAAPHLHECLAPAESLAAIHAMARQFWPFSAMVLELQLGQRAPRVGLSIRITRAELHRALAQGWSRPDAQQGSLPASPCWKPIRDFFDAWVNPVAGAFFLIENVWLELDLTAQQPAPLPAIYFDMDRAGIVSFERRMDAVHTVLKSLHDALPPASYDHLRNCVERALPDLRLAFIGVLLSRSSETLRLSLLGKSGPAILPYLSCIGWRDDRNQLLDLLAKYSRDADKLILDVDLWLRTHDPIGIELFWSPQRSWEELFSLLHSEGLCRADEAQAVLAWPGRSVVEDAGQERVIARTAGQHIECLIRRLDHVKLSFVPSPKSGVAKELCAHAYLHLSYA